MADWVHQAFRLRKNHRWKTKPGYKTFVADRGAVRFDFPADWVVIPIQGGTIEFRDQQPPDDVCVLQFTLMRLAEGVNWTGLPLPDLLRQTLSTPGRGEVIWRDEVVGVRLPNLEVTCTEYWYIDPDENREACCRWCIARAGNILPLLSIDFLRDDTDRFAPVWNEILRTLRLGEFIRDPTLGPERP